MTRSLLCTWGMTKADQHANAILRCFASRDVKLLVRAYTVYVRPPFIADTSPMTDRMDEYAVDICIGVYC